MTFFTTKMIKMTFFEKGSKISFVYYKKDHNDILKKGPKTSFPH